MTSPALTGAWAARLGTYGTEPPEVATARVRYAQRFGVFAGPNRQEVDGTTVVTPNSHPRQRVTSAPPSFANSSLNLTQAPDHWTDTGSPTGAPFTGLSRRLDRDRLTSYPDPDTQQAAATEATREAAFHRDLYAWLTGQLPGVPTTTAVRAWVDAWTAPVDPQDAL